MFAFSLNILVLFEAASNNIYFFTFQCFFQHFVLLFENPIFLRVQKFLCLSRASPLSYTGGNGGRIASIVKITIFFRNFHQFLINKLNAKMKITRFASG